MRIEHAALYVRDIERAKRFFEEFFEAKSNEGYLNPKTGFRSYFLSFEGGARLEIMTRPDIAEDKKSAYRTGFSHIAFSVGGRERVNELTERLKAAGFSVISGPRTTGDGYYESCVLDSEDNQIEITE